MCDLCDRPDLTGDDVLENISERIARNRFTAVSVGGSRAAAEFSYTVGLTELGSPELIVTGLRSQDAVRLLGVWGDYLLDESVILPGETMDAGPWFLQAVEVERPRDHLLIADRFYGESLRALQLVWADASGRWPWERGHRSRRAGQSVLGTPAPWYCDDHALDRLDVPPHL